MEIMNEKLLETLENTCRAVTLCANITEDLDYILSELNPTHLDKTTSALFDALKAATDNATSAVLNCANLCRGDILETYGDDPAKWESYQQDRLNDDAQLKQETTALQSLVARIEFQSGKELREYGAVITANRIENRKTLEDWGKGADA